MRHLSRVSVADVVALVALLCAVYGLGLLHQAAAWLGAAVGFGVASVELGKQEARRSLHQVDEKRRAV